MIWFIVWQVLFTLLEWVRLGQQSEEKDLEILLLRRQIAILERKIEKPIRTSRAERLILAVLTIRLKQLSWRSMAQLHEIIRIVQPETVFNWHRAIVRWKWTYRRSQSGRPRTNKGIEELIVRLSRENND